MTVRKIAYHGLPHLFYAVYKTRLKEFFTAAVYLLTFLQWSSSTSTLFRFKGDEPEIDHLLKFQLASVEKCLPEDAAKNSSFDLSIKGVF